MLLIQNLACGLAYFSETQKLFAKIVVVVRDDDEAAARMAEFEGYMSAVVVV